MHTGIGFKGVRVFADEHGDIIADDSRWKHIEITIENHEQDEGEKKRGQGPTDDGENSG